MKDAVIPSGHFSYCSGTEFFFYFFMVLTSSTASLILSPGLVSNADFAHARFLIKLHGSHIFFSVSHCSFSLRRKVVGGNYATA